MCPSLFLQVDNGKINNWLQYYNSRETYKAGSSTLALQAKEVFLLFRLSEWRLSMTSDLAVLQHYNGITTKLRRINRLRLRCNMTHFVTPTSNLIGVMAWRHMFHDSIVPRDNTNRSMTLIKEHIVSNYSTHKATQCMWWSHAFSMVSPSSWHSCSPTAPGNPCVPAWMETEHQRRTRTKIPSMSPEKGLLIF